MSKKKSTSKQMAAPDTDQAFDQWVARQLHKVYDEVLSEPVPDELLRLVERFDARSGAGGAGTGADKRTKGARRRSTGNGDES